MSLDRDPDNFLNAQCWLAEKHMKTRMFGHGWLENTYKTRVTRWVPFLNVAFLN